MPFTPENLIRLRALVRAGILAGDSRTNMNALCAPGGGHLFDQHAGCCGFAAVIMMLFDNHAAPPAVAPVAPAPVAPAPAAPALGHTHAHLNALCQAAFDNTTDAVASTAARPLGLQAVLGPGNKQFSLGKRLRWRKQTLGLNTIDARLDSALLILFKEKMRNSTELLHRAVWNDTREYSLLFGKFCVSEKDLISIGIKFMIPGIAGDALNQATKRLVHQLAGFSKNAGMFSIKFGDLALTKEAVCALIQFVFDSFHDQAARPFGVTIDQVNLIPLADLQTMSNNLRINPVDPGAAAAAAAAVDVQRDDAALRLASEYRNQAAAHGGNFLGAILGLAKREAVAAATAPSAAEFVGYGMIHHWVYIPRGQNLPADDDAASRALTLWTWAEVRHLPLEEPTRHFIPVWVAFVRRT